MAFSTEGPEVRLLITTTELKCNAVIEFTVTKVNHASTETTVSGIPPPDTTFEGNPGTATDTTLFTLQNIHPPGVQSFDSAR
ncbi:hypothetical protein OkiPb00181_49940 [Escherichia coli]|nr:hypothetical protein A4C50_13085 [Escherichia coli O157:H7]AOV32386.1 hypothetical protein A4C45_13080 [Escherichia coli O157:H7]